MANKSMFNTLVEELNLQEREELQSALVRVGFEWTQQFPSIVRTPGVCGGAARLIRSRVPVWTLKRMRQLGLSEIDILRSFPNLRAADLVQAFAYADARRDEVERDILENERD